MRQQMQTIGMRETEKYSGTGTNGKRYQSLAAAALICLMDWGM
jgi:hypothetical protein